MSTISLTVQPHITKMVGVPRAVYLRFPQGNMFGEPFQVEQQRLILTTALEVLGVISQPNTLLEFPLRWRARLTEA